MLLARGFVFLPASARKRSFSEGAKGSFFSSKGEALPARKGNRSAEEKFASFRRAKNCVRTQGNFYAHKNKIFVLHENKFFCLRHGKFERFTQTLLPHVLCLLFPLRIALRSQGGYLGVLALQRKALQSIGGYCPISRILHSTRAWWVASHSQGASLPTNQRQRC